jgi:hypothetical protein
MKLPRCTHCTLPVLELEGQFSKLDSLYIRDGAPPRETAGWWHARCLAESEVGPLWFEARLGNFRDVRGYQEVAVLPQWTIVREPNRGKLLAFGRHGELLSLSRGGRKHARAVAGGSIFPRVEETFHLELDDEQLVQQIKDGLVSNGSFPLPAVLDGLGIADRTVHAEALERGVFRFDKGLQEHWGRRFVSARAEYGVFVASELEPHVGELIR